MTAQHSPLRRRWVLSLVALSTTTALLIVWWPISSPAPNSPSPNRVTAGPELPQIPTAEVVARQQKKQVKRRNLHSEFEDPERALQLAATDTEAAVRLLEELDAQYGESALKSVREDLRRQIAARGSSLQPVAPPLRAAGPSATN